ncbi:MAG: methyl-accepting chemotaxis protein [Clostridia bacterium]|nr:methyl-accepting chemotaxis protein [Clostridia bacterium]
MLNRMKILQRLILLTGILISFSIAIGFIGQAGLGRIQKQMDSLYFNSLKSKETVNSIQSSCYRVEADATYIIASKDKNAEYLSRLTSIDENLYSIDSKIMALEALSENDQQKGQIKTLKSNYTKWKDLQQQLITLVTRDKRDLAIKVIAANKPLRDNMNKALIDYGSFINDTAKSKYDQSEALRAKTSGGQIMVIIILILTGLFMAVVVAYSIAKPIGVLVKHLKRIEKGDFSEALPDSIRAHGGDLGEMVKAVDIMQKAMGQAIRSVKAEAIGIDKLSEEAMEKVAVLSSDAQEISDSTEELTSYMQMAASSASMIHQNTREIELVMSTLAIKAKDSSKTAGNIQKRAENIHLEALNAQKRTENMYRTVKHSLEESILHTKAVEKISELARESLQVASQTNLLALNAAIEAAHAGEQGKSFAVVADEVGKLAEASKAMATEIMAITPVMLSAVENLAESSSKMISFVESNIMKDYQMLIQTGTQYKEDASYLSDISVDLDKTAQSVLDSVQRISYMTDKLNETNMSVTLEAEKIAEKAIDAAQLSRNVSDKSIEVKFYTGQLREAVKGFITQ